MVLEISKKLGETILKLWENPDFPGSGTGLANFRACLHVYKNIDVSIHQLSELFRQNNVYLQSLIKRNRFPRRHYLNVNGYFSLCQCDLMYLPKRKYWIGALVFIDVFSQKLFLEKITNRKGDTLKKKLDMIFDRAKAYPNVLQSDQEFKFYKAWYKERGIYSSIKYGLNKASFAEGAIHKIRRRLSQVMKSRFDGNWPAYIDKVVLAINKQVIIVVFYEIKYGKYIICM